MVSKYILNQIRASWRDLYPHDKGTGKYEGIICPICGSGSGAHGTGITENPHVPGNLHCWRCGFQGDVIDLVQQEQQTDFVHAVQYAAEALGITIFEEKSTEESPAVRKEEISSASACSETTAATVTNEGNPQEYAAWTMALQESGSPGAAYLARRRISVDTAVRMGVGYADKWRSPKAVAAGKDIPPSPRLIFPKGPESYATRDIRSDEELTEKSRKYVKQNHGSGGIFNENVLWETSSEPVIVCEGPMDALSAAEAGYDALAVCGTSGRTFLSDLLRQHPTSRLLLVALDADDAGRVASAKLTEDLRTLNVATIECGTEICLGKKDLNEALCEDRPLFQSTLEAAVSIAVQQQKKQQLDAVRRYTNTHSTAAYMEGFDARVARRSEIPTGFSRLDDLLGGGLYPGLYIVGAISSLGKTTYCLQLMDQIAAAGQDVMIFSLEMGRDELIAKSLSRLTYQLERASEWSVPKDALTTLGIFSGTRRALYTARQHELYNAAYSTYRDTVAGQHYIFESNGDIGATQIRDFIGNHIQVTGNKPVVLVDYLQILAPADLRATDKQNTDRAVFMLKAMSRDYEIPVIGISSFNRENYSAPVSQASFKESGAIEYSSDILIGLQYEGMDLRSGEGDKERAKRIWELRVNNQQRVRQGMAIRIQLKVLKNRNGELGDITFLYNPRYNAYADTSLR